jgi:putative flippase GtrA
VSSEDAKLARHSTSRSTRRWLARHSAPRFVIVGCVGAVLDVGLLRLCFGSLGMPLLLATAVAYVGSAGPVFVVNRQWSFGPGSGGPVHRQVLRYLSLTVANLLSTVALVGVLHWIGVFYLLAKVVAIAVNAVANFFAYERWVFA